MSTPVTTMELSELELFRGLPEASLVELASRATRHDLADSEVVYEEGGPSTHVSVIVHGLILLRIHRGDQPILVGALQAGDVFGWASLRPDPVALTTARATGTVQLISIPAASILDLAASGTPEGRALIQRLMDVAARRLSRAHEQIVRHDDATVISGG